MIKIQRAGIETAVDSGLLTGVCKSLVMDLPGNSDSDEEIGGYWDKCSFRTGPSYIYNTTILTSAGQSGQYRFEARLQVTLEGLDKIPRK